jgi:hypothetical protein
MQKRAHNLRWPIFLCVCFVLFLISGCTKEQNAPTLNLSRGLAGLELGMTPEQVGQLFTVKEDTDPVAALLTKYGKPEDGNAISQQNKTLKKQYFRISSGVGKLPDGITSADAYSTHGILYQIGLHYDDASMKKLSWKDITYPYLAKYGKPVKDTGSGYVWDDGRSRLDIESSGSMINVFFFDQILETEVKKSEREKP